MQDNRIRLAHGGGGQLTAELIHDVILPALGEAGAQDAEHLSDAAGLDFDAGRVAFTTDTYVVQPLEFPGGDIGKLAVCGTVNDLAVAGAAPAAISIALVIAEGMEIELLGRLLASAGRAAAEAGVKIVTGDTKVVGRDALDGLVINTTGVGQLRPEASLGFERIKKDDAVILSGPPGEHGLAVMCLREGLEFTGELQSDCAAVDELTADLLESLGDSVHFMRDPTRGGVAATLVELAESAGADVEIRQKAIPMNQAALAAGEMLGLDLLSVANEGKLVAVVDGEAAEKAVEVLRRHPIASRAANIGRICDKSENPFVEMVTSIGGRRIIRMPYGEELPRIC